MDNTVRVCVPKRLPASMRRVADALAIKENPENLHVSGLSLGKEKLALSVGNKWANGRLLHVRFLNGSPTQRAKVTQKAKLWEAWANLSFAFDQSPTAELRVTFRDAIYNDPGSWSFIGTDSLSVSQEEQTIHFGWLEDNTPDAEYERVVVHEFGHAIGCLHEDQQPASRIPWDKPTVYSYFMGPPNNFTKDDVDTNILDPISEAGTAHTDFDGTSIMAYAIPPQFTLNHVGIPGGNTLSAMDKAFIAQMYPKTPVTPVPPTPPSPPQPPPPTFPVVTVNGQWVPGIFQEPHKASSYSLVVPINGHVQVWSSILGGGLELYVPSIPGKPIIRSTRQFTSYLKAGTYLLLVHPHRVQTIASFRIQARYVR